MFTLGTIPTVAIPIWNLCKCLTEPTVDTNWEARPGEETKLEIRDAHNVHEATIITADGTQPSIISGVLTTSGCLEHNARGKLLLDYCIYLLVL